MIVLPKTNKETGRPYLSYSQYTAWKDPKSFSLGVLGKYEYMMRYFLGHDFGDQGWAQFGKEVEDYICERTGAEKFTDAERATLETIKPLGVFQKEFRIDFGEFDLIGFWDDTFLENDYYPEINDFKTCSKASSAKYYKDDYYQLDVYAMAALQETGKLPDRLKVTMIERKGNCMFGKGRKALSVGTQVWEHYRETSQERLDFLRADILKVAQEISMYYQMFLRLNK